MIFVQQNVEVSMTPSLTLWRIFCRRNIATFKGIKELDQTFDVDADKFKTVHASGDFPVFL